VYAPAFGCLLLLITVTISVAILSACSDNRDER
jgi:hypothetical protein